MHPILFLVVIIVGFVLFKCFIGKMVGVANPKRIHRKLNDANSSDLKCAYCCHCKRLDPDGVLCKYGNSHTFKNHVHINNCIDFQRN